MAHVHGRKKPKSQRRGPHYDSKGRVKRGKKKK